MTSILDLNPLQTQAKNPYEIVLLRHKKCVKFNTLVRYETDIGGCPNFENHLQLQLVKYPNRSS